jgi:hypothetical protein
MKIIHILKALLIFGVVCILHGTDAWSQDYSRLQEDMFLKGISAKGGIVTSQDLGVFMTKLKMLKIGVDTSDDIISKIGSPMEKSKGPNSEIWNYTARVDKQFITTCLTFSSDLKLTSVSVRKGSDTLYSAGQSSSSDKNGNSAEQGLVPTNSEAPVTPKEGQIYFNTTDKHAYLWNGAEWVQLDQPKPTP